MVYLEDRKYQLHIHLQPTYVYGLVSTMGLLKIAKSGENGVYLESGSWKNIVPAADIKILIFTL